MPQIINTNVSSLTAQRNLNMSQASLATSLQRLSSGLRINSAKDDAAGLAISQRMGAQIRALNQSVRNANDGISMIQTAEGAMNQVQDMLQRMKELGSQAANDTLGANERGFINDELTELRTEINNISDRTNFNGQYLLNGSSVTSIDTATSTLYAGFNVTNGAVTNVDVSGAKAGITYTFADDGAGGLSVSWSTDGGTTTQTETVTTATVLDGTSGTLNFANAGIKISLAASGGDISGVEADLDTLTIDTQAGSSSINLQVGDGTTSANQISVSFVNINIENSTDVGIAALKTALDNFAAGYDGTGTTSAGDLARALMDASTTALDSISSNRAQLGAKLNRLDYTVANLQTTSENLAASKSRIQDADFAAETANLTRAQILQQAGTAMLAQANSLPQNVLSLLRG
ncbi:MAG: flagellin [Zoogloeaceae bacterium]|nr:flagellin [Zoogloeaceae bacterium]